MDNYCRLCAEVRMSHEFIGKITDAGLNMLPKLFDCCRWNRFEGQDHGIFPQNVCVTCFQKLNQCWEFAESVAFAQNSLHEKIKSIESPNYDNCKDSILDCDFGPEIMQYADEMAFSGNPCNSEENYDSAEILNWIHEWDRSEKESMTEALEASITLEASKVLETPRRPEIPEKELEIPVQILELPQKMLEIPEKTVDTSLQLRRFRRKPNSAEPNDFNHNENGKENENGNEKEKENECTVDEPKQKNERKLNKESNSENIPAQNELSNEKNEQQISNQKNDQKRSIARWLTYTIPDENFLKQLRNEDRNEDGTVRPERIAELKLSDWMIMQYQCYICNVRLSSLHTLRSHVTSEHPKEHMRNKCFLCTSTKRTYLRPSILIKHIMEHHLPHLKHW